MLIAIIGGKLQGAEAVYLAQKAGWKTLLIDKDRHAPATGLCDDFLEFEFSLEHPVPADELKIDFILPAIEDDIVLEAVVIWANEKKIPLAFDLDAYRLSSSKQQSDTLFKKMKLPMPLSWPDCDFPILIKPDEASGSRGVEVFYDSGKFVSRFPDPCKMKYMVIQEYLPGPSYSIEVIGSPPGYQSFQVTQIHMDSVYDCKRVTAPTPLPSDQIQEFKQISIAIAKEIGLNGIMDVEVIFNNNELKLLEIDARLPSQTPITIYWSTGVNMVEKLGQLVLKKSQSTPEKANEKFVILEHIKVSGFALEFLGEHIMGMEGPLLLKTEFFGANEAITSFSPGKNQWVATLIFCGNSKEEVYKRKKQCHEQILHQMNTRLQGA